MLNARQEGNLRNFSRRVFIRGVAALASGPALAACGSERRSTRISNSASRGEAPVRGGTLTVRSGSDVSILDYAYNHDVYSGFVVGNCVEALLTHDPQAKPQGMLAASWETPDPATYVFHLRPGVAFHDDTQLTSDSAFYSLERSRSD